MSDLVTRLRMEARRDPEIQHSGHSILSDAADEIERLRAALEIIARTIFSGATMDDNYQRGNHDAHKTCATIARAALHPEQRAVSSDGA